MESEVEILSRRIHGELTVTVKKEVRKRAEESYRWAVVLKLSNGSAFNAPAMVEALMKAWNIKEELGYREMTQNKLVVKLRSEEEQNRVLQGGPWTLGGWAVVVEKWRNGVAPSEYCCNTIRIWVQVHNIPVEYRDGNTPMELAGLVGEVVKEEKQDGNKEVARRRWDRFRVIIEVDKPILHGVVLAEEGRAPVWIEYKYERLPVFCFRCGRLSHESNHCDYEVDYPISKRRYGKWLKADFQRPAGAPDMASELRSYGEIEEGHGGERDSPPPGAGGFRNQQTVARDPGSSDGHVVEMVPEKLFENCAVKLDKSAVNTELSLGSGEMSVVDQHISSSALPGEMSASGQHISSSALPGEMAVVGQHISSSALPGEMSLSGQHISSSAFPGEVDMVDDEGESTNGGLRSTHLLGRSCGPCVEGSDKGVWLGQVVERPNKLPSRRGRRMEIDEGGINETSRLRFHPYNFGEKPVKADRVTCKEVVKAVTNANCGGRSAEAGHQPRREQ
ncbi:unnamed protein product [Rhodiola kirilowii]